MLILSFDVLYYFYVEISWYEQLSGSEEKTFFV